MTFLQLFYMQWLNFTRRSSLSRILQLLVNIFLRYSYKNRYKTQKHRQHTLKKRSISLSRYVTCSGRQQMNLKLLRTLSLSQPPAIPYITYLKGVFQIQIPKSACVHFSWKQLVVNMQTKISSTQTNRSQYIRHLLCLIQF